MRAALLVPVVFVSSLTACGDDGGSQIDARIIGDGQADARSCAVIPQLGSPTPADEIATRDVETMPDEIYYESSLNQDPLYDALTIQLYKGHGAFELGEIEPKVIPLNVAESQWETCGACVVIYADYDNDQEEALGGTYLASGGSLNLAAVSPNIRGMLLNTRLVEVVIDDDTGVSTEVGNCATELVSFQFDFPVTTDEPEFTATGKKPRVPRKPSRRR